MYPTSGATIRDDLRIVVEEASHADRHYIARNVLPPMGVEAKAGIYPKLEIAGGELMTAGSTIRTRGSSYGQITRKWTTDTYDCVDRGLEEPIDDTDVKDLARFFGLESAIARLVLRNMQLDYEIRVKDAIFNTTNFGAATNSAVAYTENLLATIDFPQDIIAACERINDNGMEANTIVISSTVLNRLKRSKLLKEWVRGTLQGESQLPINADSIGKAFRDHGITQCLVGRARYNAAKKGQAKNMALVWPTNYVWVGYVNPSARSPQEGGAGFTLTWNAEGGLFVSETYRDDSRRSNFVRVRQNTTEKITDPTCGTLIATQWA